MVNVAHDRHDWWARTQLFGSLCTEHILHALHDAYQLFRHSLGGLNREVGSNERCRLVINLLIDIGENSTLQERLQNLGGTNARRL